MLFTSAIFIFLFLPVVLLTYYLLPVKYKNIQLLLASLFFYTWGEWLIVLVMLASTVIDFSAGLIIEHKSRKLGLGMSIIANLGFLAFFKYANFAFENYNDLINFLNISNKALINLPNIALPIGISFYTFQTMSYTIDVYRGKVKANRNFVDFATYVTMFPQLIAGPIVRYIDINRQLKKRELSINKFALGTERFIIGLAKKMIIANAFAGIADKIFALPPSDLSFSAAWIGIIAYSFQIFFDFSAYSDMAIGLGKMFGFDILENFNYPYISKSIKEFWRRWHISLSSWFRDYLYISLGGNRVGRLRLYVNLFIVFFVTGLWHGASWNFVVWGLFHGFFLVLERVYLGKILEKTWKPVAHIYTLLVVILAWVFFRADNLSLAIGYFKAMFGLNTNNQLYDIRLFVSYEHWFILFVAIVFSTPVYLRIKNFMAEKANEMLKLKNALNYCYSFFILSLFVLCVSYIASDTYNPFIYFRF